MSDAAIVGRWVGWLIDLYLVVGLLLVIVLVPQAAKALREFWWSGEMPFWIFGAVAVLLFFGYTRLLGW